MSDMLNSETERENTVVLSGNLDSCDVLDCVQVTLAKLEAESPAVTLYRFVDGEEVTSFELSGFEMSKLIDVYAGRPTKYIVTALLERSKNRLQHVSSFVCPDLVASDILAELVTAFSKTYLSEAQQAHVQGILDGASAVIVQESRKKSA